MPQLTPDFPYNEQTLHNRLLPVKLPCVFEIACVEVIIQGSPQDSAALLSFLKSSVEPLLGSNTCALPEVRKTPSMEWLCKAESETFWILQKAWATGHLPGRRREWGSLNHCLKGRAMGDLTVKDSDNGGPQPHHLHTVHSTPIFFSFPEHRQIYSGSLWLGPSHCVEAHWDSPVSLAGSKDTEGIFM